MANDPQAFISYSWSSPEHEKWVLDLATQLRENGVDVKLDKWDLKEGHDAIKFMEQMVTDPNITKVIVVLDRQYAEKADRRKGGVGKETQIISPEIYEKADQNKFVGVISERGDDGNPFLPTFYKSRIYIDLSQLDIYATNFDQLLRWIYDKPPYPKPPIGSTPAFLNENAIVLPTGSRATRAISLLQSAAPNAMGALSEYLTTLAESVEMLRITEFHPTTYDEAIVESVASFTPYRDEYITVISTFAKYASAADASPIHKFFEQAIPYMFRPKSVMKYFDYYWDNFKFIIHELFLYTIAFLLKHERFDLVLQLMTDGYYVPDVFEDASKPIQEFEIIRQDITSLRDRKQRLALNRVSVRADMLDQRSHASGLHMSDLMQADFILFFFGSMMSLQEDRKNWYPDTLLYFETYRSRPFEIFARAQSKKYYDRIRPLLAGLDKDHLGEAFKQFGEGRTLFLPNWGFRSLKLTEVTNFEKLATRP